MTTHAFNIWIMHRPHRRLRETNGAPTSQSNIIVPTPALYERICVICTQINSQSVSMLHTIYHWITGLQQHTVISMQFTHSQNCWNLQSSLRQQYVIVVFKQLILIFREVKTAHTPRSVDVTSATGRLSWLHGFKHINSLLSVALANLFQRLVFVTALGNILLMKNIVAGGLHVQFDSSQIGTQRLKHTSMYQLQTDVHVSRLTQNQWKDKH